jgi:hypothetical protein
MTNEEIEKLNAYQKNPRVHPMTCGNNRTDEKHLDGEGVLVATENGWICPYCDYRQPYHSVENIILNFSEDYL